MIKISKLSSIGCYNNETGEDLSWEVVSSVQKEDNNNKIKKLYYLLENKPEELTTDDLIVLMKLENRPNTTANTIKLDFGKDGYFTCRRDLNLVGNLHDYTKAFLWSISHLITHDGRLKYENNKVISSQQKLKKYLNISNDKWNTYIKPDIEEYNIIVKEKIDNRWCLLLNPIFATTTRTFTETMFIAFHEDFKKYLHPLEYLYLQKFHGINP